MSAALGGPNCCAARAAGGGKKSPADIDGLHRRQRLGQYCVFGRPKHHWGGHGKTRCVKLGIAWQRSGCSVVLRAGYDNFLANSKYSGIFGSLAAENFESSENGSLEEEEIFSKT